MGKEVHKFCDFCGDPLKDDVNYIGDETPHYTARVLKRIAKHKLGIIRRTLHIGYDSHSWETKKYDMCPKCFKLLQDLCEANAHLPTEHYKRVQK